METKVTRKGTSGLKTSKKRQAAQEKLAKAFKKWRAGGMSRSKEDPLRIKYLSAKYELQRLGRYEESLSNIKHNCSLMNAHAGDRNRIYTKMKKFRGEKSSSKPLKLETPVGLYLGDDVLEGFAADAEFLGRARGEGNMYDNEFYRLCMLDNAYIFDFKEEKFLIPPMTKQRLEEILSSMKRGKACDIYQLTAEHLQECGEAAKMCILNLLNSIIANIYYLTCPQAKAGLGSSIHKGKKKPRDKSKSYRRITVSPQIGCILDRYIDPLTEQIFRSKQSPDQLGFTKSVSYLLASVQRGECQRWAVDKKMTCFGVSLDGEAAFPSVDRDIQVRELYSVGESGDFLQYSRNTYQNTNCTMKLDGKLSRCFSEYTGNRQGHVKAAGHFKAYINPCLDTVNSTDLGFHIGPISVGTECCADDTYLQSDSQSGLQGLIDIVGHYAKRYRVIFNADKTKIVVTGSRHDMDYYKDVGPWSLNGERIAVVTNNEHLGLIVSGLDEEQKNVDQNLTQCRNSLFALLGPALSYKCKLSPQVQLHLWRTYSLPVLKSGLSALPLRPTDIKPLQIFQNKIMRGFLKQSFCSPVPSLYFLCGELPIEGQVHIDLLGLFFNIWSNPSTKIFEIVKYIMKMAGEKSTTWSYHVRLIAKKYKLPDPLLLMDQAVWSKETWKTLVTNKVLVYHESEMREKALSNYKLEYFNVQLLGLNGLPYPALHNIQDTREILKMKAHLKFLTGDIDSYHHMSLDRGVDPSCRLCSAPCEHTQHILTECCSTAEIRDRLYPQLVNIVSDIQPSCGLLKQSSNHLLTQFIIDPSSMNLPNTHRISSQHPRLHELFRISRDWCFSINTCRTKLLKEKNLR